MTDKELIKKLDKLGYTKLWLTSGILTIEELIKQEQLFDNHDDKNIEHFRYNALKSYLANKSKLSDIEFDNYIKLTFNDNDNQMAGTATVDLFKTNTLTDVQFEKLCDAVRQFGEWTEKVIKRQRLLRRLRHKQLTNDLLIESIESDDSIIQEYIIDIADISQLQEIAIKGTNKRIRNLARDKQKRLTGN